MEGIKVSVFILTYNQEAVIGQTIESILMQQTDFPFQLVIGEDASADATLEICKSYAAKNPQQFKLLPAEKNMGLIKNFMRTLKECDGAYIAICDGDDYWTDANKLQKQVAFLDHNEDYSIVFSLKEDLLANGEFQASKQRIMPETTSFDDLVMDNYIPSVTALFRNKTISSDPPSWIVHFPFGDWPLYLWTLLDGKKIFFMNEVMAVYRTQLGASFRLRKQLSNALEVKLRILQYALKDDQFAEKKQRIDRSIHAAKDLLMRSYNRERKYGKAILVFLGILASKPSFRIIKMYFYTLYKSVA